MKTPKQILWEQHADAESKLDTIRERVVSGLLEPEHHAAGTYFFLNEAWRELFWRARHVWSGLAAVWAILLVISVAQSGSGAALPSTAKNPSPHPAPVWERHQNALRAELGLPFERQDQKPDRNQSKPDRQSRFIGRFEWV